MVWEQIWKKLFWTIFGPTDDPRDPTLARALCALNTTLLCQNGASKGDDNMEKGFKVIPFIVLQHHKGAQCNSRLKNTLRERAT